MFNISGLNALLKVIRDTGIKPTKLHILSGVSKARHGMWIVTHKGLVEEEGYGITSLVDYNIKEANMFTEETMCKYIGLTEGQQECCVFGIEAGEDEMIKMKTSLNTKVGKRVVCDNDCDNHNHNHEPLVVIKTVKENKDGNSDTELSEQDIGKPRGGAGESNYSGGDGESEGSGDAEGLETTDTIEDISTESEGQSGYTSTEGAETETGSETTTDSETIETGIQLADLDVPVAPDFEYAQSLSKTGNKNEQKATLEEYARRFNIELNRGTKFDAMMADFKEKASA